MYATKFLVAPFCSLHRNTRICLFYSFEIILQMFKHLIYARMPEKKALDDFGNFSWLIKQFSSN